MEMTPELWVIIIAAAIPGVLALGVVVLSNIFAWGERDAKVENLDSDTVKTNTETIILQQKLINNLRERLNNLEIAIGEERALRRRDKQGFNERITALKKQHEQEIDDLKSKYEYEMKALELRVKELEDQLDRAEKSRTRAQEERDAARAENHGLLEENYKLRQQIAGDK